MTAVTTGSVARTRGILCRRHIAVSLFWGRSIGFRISPRLGSGHREVHGLASSNGVWGKGDTGPSSIGALTDQLRVRASAVHEAIDRDQRQSREVGSVAELWPRWRRPT